jgi:signal transduction histidine kinase/CheY-like chemotaxis protein
MISLEERVDRGETDTADLRPRGAAPVSGDVLDRAALIARGLFEGADSRVVLVGDGKPARSRPQDPSRPTTEIMADAVMAHGDLVWIEDAREDPRFSSASSLGGQPGACIGAPIRVAGGETVGVLTVAAPKPRPFQAARAAELQAVADLVAGEWERARRDGERNVAEQNLAVARATSAAVFSQVPMSLVLTDTELRVVAASRVWEDHLQATDYVGRHLFDVGGAIYEPFRSSLNHALQGHPIHSPRARVGEPGQEIWMSTAVSPWRRPSGEIGGLLILANEITDLVEALDRSARAEERLNLALELADVHVWELDYLRGELLTAGAGDTFFERPLTYADLHRDIYRTVDARDREAVREAWRAHVETSQPYRPRYRVARSDGKEVWVEGAIRYMTTPDGRPQRMVGAIRNITSRMADERAILAARDEAEASNRAKSTFLATMSHEIRTPLNGVLGMAQAMEADTLSPAQKERLRVVRQSGETLLAILNDVLDLSKIEAAKLELDAAEFEINELARGAYAAFTAIANKKGLSFSLTVEPAAEGVYLGDSVRLRQILYNLVSNAVKFTERGEVRVHVDRVGEELRLCVSDTGIGIAPEPLSRLFSKFEQADASTTRRYGGTGLGLAICRELAQLMGGAIRAESREGVGSSFFVRLPLPRVAAARPTLPAAPPPPPATAPQQASLRILAAEDNEINRLVLQTLLQQVGVSPTLVNDGAAAVAAWSAEHWDLVLMDIQMPNLDGPAACRMIRDMEANTGRPRTPIVALTANAMTHQVAEYLAAGMDAFVPKPIEVGALFAAMEAVLATTPAGPGADPGDTPRGVGEAARPDPHPSLI